ncbi:MAG: hypothetical protein QOI12_2984 [Alphaproteobacteria bacterium]|jgi:hypothetical protein|nr:hypothetical protein [Alphaproteobacteria bacterium]
MTIPFSETPTVGLGQFIKEVRFQVPSHQRDYSWKEEYVKQFIDDITGALGEREDLYFCGLMVFTKTEQQPAFQVLDGQQRLATTLMIVSAIRNWLGGYGAFKKAQTQIEERYLGDSELGKTEIEPKLALNAANNDFFRRFVIEAVPLNDIEDAVRKHQKEGRNRALLEATLYVNKRVKEIADKYTNKEDAKDYLLSLVNYLTETVQIVRLVVHGDEAAYTIFETLNDRGMDLAPLDLVKNYLFSRAEKGKKSVGKSLRDLEERWTEMMTLLSGVKADSFLRSFWASKHGAPVGRKLFGPFKKQYSDPAEAYKVSIDMRSAAERYVALTDSSDPIWTSHSEKAKRSVEALNIIGVTQAYPILLAALPVFEVREMERLLRLIEVIAVRYQLVARGRPGRIESLGGRAAKAVSEGKIKTAHQVFQELKELYIPDLQFEAEFQLKIERESKKAAYLLRGLEHQSLLRAQEKHADELVPSTIVTVEHIMPKSPGDGWKKEITADPELHSECLYRLGNLCLLADANRALGNKPFAQKRLSYVSSKLRTTNSVSKYETWGRAQIEERQGHLAKLAGAEWRFS